MKMSYKLLIQLILVLTFSSAAFASFGGAVDSGGDPVHRPIAQGIIEAIGQRVCLNSKSKLTIKLQDVSFMDVAATELLSITYSKVEQLPIRFTLDGVEVQDWSNLIVSVHLDIDGDGKVSRGDLITTQSYPVRWNDRFLNISLQSI
ncbi:MAG: YbaY family lipoprotein [Bacteriovoracaceae bacterium]|nr:YbaY family lipoprotein [Bacteriovoracaceae bacterium]